MSAESNPDPVALHATALDAYRSGRLDDACRLLQQAICQSPDPVMLNNLGVTLRRLGRVEDAVTTYQRATAMDPAFTMAHVNLGRALQDLNRLDAARACFERAIELMPEHAEAHMELGSTLRRMGMRQQGVAALEQAIRLQPQFAEAHFRLAAGLLQLGHFGRGWQEQEWRWQWPGFATPKRDFSAPRWDGTDLNGKTILLHAEQGLGDTIQFARYVPLVVARGGRVVLECQSGLGPLLGSLPGLWAVRERGQTLPPFDVHAPLMSLPAVLGTTLDTIPRSVPYLRADSSQTARWASRLRSDGRARVGLVWAGNPAHSDDWRRSLTLSALDPLTRLPHARFYSLQKGPAAAQVIAGCPNRELVDLSNDLVRFSDTAAVLPNLDLVITVDTAVAHLAGALARPCWVLLSAAPDWRWLIDRDDSPWYPTVRLFRQQHLGDWSDPIARVTAELERLLSQSARPTRVA